MDSRDSIVRACKRPAFAEKVEYSRKQGQKYDRVARAYVDNIISGPSIRFAEVALRAWRNIDALTQVVYDDEDIRRIKISVMDLETNTAFNKEITVRKTVERKKAFDREVLAERTTSDGNKVFILRATDEEVTNKENAMISKVIRNEGLRLIPGDIIDDALAMAKETLRNRDKEDPDGAKKRILDSFSELGIRPAEVVKYLGHPTDTISPKELETLRGIYRALKDGEATWQDYMNPPEEVKPETPAPEPTAEEQKVLEQWQLLLNSCSLTPQGLEYMAKFVSQAAVTQQISEIEVKVAAVKDFANFHAMFNAWLVKQGPMDSKPEAPKTESPKENLEKKTTRGPRGPYKKKEEEKGEGQPPPEEPPRDITPETLAKIREMCQAQDIDEKMICYDADVSTLTELTEQYGLQVIKFYEEA